MSLKDLIKKLPFVANILQARQNGRFPGSADYWEQRYEKGGNSGSGSYNRLAEFKAEVLNDFVAKNGINSVLELGCGDGNQLKLAKYPKYTGLDISATIIGECRQTFAGDETKAFYVNRPENLQNTSALQADLSLSLDVIFHLVEDAVFEQYMNDLFAYAKKYVIIYSSNFIKDQSFHEKDRRFTDWVAKNQVNWKLVQEIKNKFPFKEEDPDNTSKADFFIYELI